PVGGSCRRRATGKRGWGRLLSLRRADWFVEGGFALGGASMLQDLVSSLLAFAASLLWPGIVVWAAPPDGYALQYTVTVTGSGAPAPMVVTWDEVHSLPGWYLDGD